MTTGELIRNARKDAGMTQKQLAEKLNVSQAMIGQYECGNRNPKTETLKKIADALEIPWYFLSEEYQAQEDEYNEMLATQLDAFEEYITSLHISIEKRVLHPKVTAEDLAEKNIPKEIANALNNYNIGDTQYYVFTDHQNKKYYLTDGEYDRLRDEINAKVRYLLKQNEHVELANNEDADSYFRTMAVTQIVSLIDSLNFHLHNLSNEPAINLDSEPDETPTPDLGE